MRGITWKQNQNGDNLDFELDAFNSHFEDDTSLVSVTLVDRMEGVLPEI